MRHHFQKVVPSFSRVTTTEYGAEITKILQLRQIMVFLGNVAFERVDGTEQMFHLYVVCSYNFVADDSVLICNGSERSGLKRRTVFQWHFVAATVLDSIKRRWTELTLLKQLLLLLRQRSTKYIHLRTSHYKIYKLT